jgi:hypothetical protein
MVSSGQAHGLPPAWYWARLASTMIAAMAAAVSVVSTFRLASLAVGFSSGKPEFADRAGALMARRAEAGSGSAANPLKATGCAEPVREAPARTGAWLIGALWW